MQKIRTEGRITVQDNGKVSRKAYLRTWKFIRSDFWIVLSKWLNLLKFSSLPKKSLIKAFNLTSNNYFQNISLRVNTQQFILQFPSRSQQKSPQWPAHKIQRKIFQHKSLRHKAFNYSRYNGRIATRSLHRRKRKRGRRGGEKKIWRRYKNTVPQSYSICAPARVQPPGKTLAPVAGIITKRRIKLHDILLLSRFPLIK